MRGNAFETVTALKSAIQGRRRAISIFAKLMTSSTKHVYNC